MRSHAGSVLKLQRIVGNLGFIFATNDLQTSVAVLFAETLETYTYDFEC